MQLTNFLGVSLPIIQSPMAGIQDSKLAIAVNLAGGLGSVPCAALSLSEMEQELRTISENVDGPINFNFFVIKYQP